jgi:xylobiose transport system substrate-binding protein
MSDLRSSELTDTGVSRRRFLGLTAAAGASAGVAALAGCGTSGPAGAAGGSGGGGGGGTDSIWVLTDAVENPIQTTAIDAFNRKSSAKMALFTVSNADYTNKLRVAMGSPNQPAVFFNWGGGSIAPYVSNGDLVDLTSYLDADPAWKQSFLPSVLTDGQIDGKYYGIPLRGVQPVVLFYNKTMFARYGLSTPQSYADLLSAGDKLKSHGVIPMALGGADQWPELMWLEIISDRLGGFQPFQALAADPATGWANPVFAQTLSMIQDLVGRGFFGSSFSSVGYNDGAASALFGTGRAAMHLMGTWEYTNLLSQHASFAQHDLAFTNFPAISGGKGDPSAVVGNPTNYFSITKKAPDVAAAVSFLKKEMTSPAYVNKLIATGDVPAINGLSSRLATAPNSQFAQWVYAAVQNASSFELSWDQALPSATATPMLTNLAKVFLKQSTPQQFVSAMQHVQ